MNLNNAGVHGRHQAKVQLPFNRSISPRSQRKDGPCAMLSTQELRQLVAAMID